MDTGGLSKGERVSKQFSLILHACLISATEEMNWERLAAVMVAELFVLVFLFDLYLFWRYEKGVMHWIIDKCHRFSKGTALN